MNTKQDALDLFRKAVSFLYREIGVLDIRSHPDIASKAVLASRFFGMERKRIAKELYHKTKTEEDTEQGERI